jgi:molybdopterin/thiamine biosynthesis adenylyltransferase
MDLYYEEIDYESISWYRKFLESNVFMVGAGGLGCEMQKLLACMKANVTKDLGSVFLLDYDTVQISNLNRQY